MSKLPQNSVGVTHAEGSMTLSWSRLERCQWKDTYKTLVLRYLVIFALLSLHVFAINHAERVFH